MRKNICILLAILLFTLSFLMVLPRAKAELITVRVGYMPQFFVQEATLYTAIEKGFFEEQGLKVELYKFPSGPPIVAALGAGSLDIGELGWGAYSLMTAKKLVVPIIINTVNYHGDLIIAWPESGIKTIADLKGKRVILSKGTSAELILINALESVGLKEEDVILIDIPNPADAVPAFLRKEGDAFATWYPSNVYVQEKAPQVIKICDNEYFWPTYAYPNGYVTTEKFLKEHPDIVKKWLKAYIKANDYLLGHVDEIARRAEPYNGLPYDKCLENWRMSLAMPFYMWIPFYENKTIGMWFNKLYKLWEKMGKLESPPDAREIFAMPYTIEAAKEYYAEQLKVAPTTVTKTIVSTVHETLTTTIAGAAVTKTVTNVITETATTTIVQEATTYLYASIGLLVLVVILIAALLYTKRKK